MVWFFERGREISTLEVRRHDARFAVSFRHDGNEQIDIVSTPRDLLTRLEQVPRLVLADGWRPIQNRR